MIEKILERLENELKLADEEKERCSRENPLQFDRANGYASGIDTTIEIVQEVAKEYGDGWIPVEERLPKENGWYWGYYVTSSYRGTDGVRHTECKYASIYWEDNLWLYDARGFRTVDEVIAWKPIAPYQKGEPHE